MTELPTKVIALDPGITTGYAVGVIEDGSLGVVSGQERWRELDMHNELQRLKPDIVIYESFEHRRTKRHDNVEMFSRNIIGVVNMYCQSTGAKPVVQTPAQGKSNPTNYFNDNVLKEYNVYKTRGPHANDAMRHLLNWWTFGSGYQYNNKGFKSLA